MVAGKICTTPQGHHQGRVAVSRGSFWNPFTTGLGLPEPLRRSALIRQCAPSLLLAGLIIPDGILARLGINNRRKQRAGQSG